MLSERSSYSKERSSARGPQATSEFAGSPRWAQVRRNTTHVTALLLFRAKIRNDVDRRQTDECSGNG